MTASPYVIAVVNQKGGVGKTTSAVNLGACLAASERPTLLIDMDPQANASSAYGIVNAERQVYDALIDEVPLTSCAYETELETLHVVPAGRDLVGAEIELVSKAAREFQLDRAIKELGDAYEIVLIDCPPNVGLLTFNALRAAREVIVPLETSFFAIDGVQKLLETIGLLSDRIGHELQVRVLPTLYDGRTRYARQTLGDIRELFKELCFDSVIRLNVKLREAARRGLPISLYAPSANGAQDYASVALELAASPPSRRTTDEKVVEDVSTGPPREIVVRYRDAAAGDVRIAGDFNGWVPDRGVRSLIASEGGDRVWTKVLTLEPGTYQYRYVVDGEWREDPTNPESAPGPTGQPNSILMVR